MDPLVHEWLNLAIRWAHVMFGIAWIGSSLYFMWLDASLEPPDPPRCRIGIDPGHGGDEVRRRERRGLTRRPRRQGHQHGEAPQP